MDISLFHPQSLKTGTILQWFFLLSLILAFPSLAIKVGDKFTFENKTYEIVKIHSSDDSSVVFEAKPPPGSVTTVILKAFKISALAKNSAPQISQFVDAIESRAPSHLVRVYTSGNLTIDGESYSAYRMSYYGVSLKAHADQGKLRIDAINLAQRARIDRLDSALQLLDHLWKASQELKALGLVHHNITPQNVVVYNGKWKLTGFESVSQDGKSPMITAPLDLSTAALEHGSNVTPNQNSDTFAIASTLYYALYGKTPLDAFIDFYHGTQPNSPALSQAEMRDKLRTEEAVKNKFNAMILQQTNKLKQDSLTISQRQALAIASFLEAGLRLDPESRQDAINLHYEKHPLPEPQQPTMPSSLEPDATVLEPDATVLEPDATVLESDAIDRVIHHDFSGIELIASGEELSRFLTEHSERRSDLQGFLDTPYVQRLMEWLKAPHKHQTFLREVNSIFLEHRILANALLNEFITENLKTEAGKRLDPNSKLYFVTFLNHLNSAVKYSNYNLGSRVFEITIVPSINEVIPRLKEEVATFSPEEKNRLFHQIEKLTIRYRERETDIRRRAHYLPKLRAFTFGAPIGTLAMTPFLYDSPWPTILSTGTALVTISFYQLAKKWHFESSLRDEFPQQFILRNLQKTLNKRPITQKVCEFIFGSVTQ